MQEISELYLINEKDSSALNTYILLGITPAKFLSTVGEGGGLDLGVSDYVWILHVDIT